jgi:hypothetical protein
MGMAGVAAAAPIGGIRGLMDPGKVFESENDCRRGRFRLVGAPLG